MRKNQIRRIIVIGILTVAGLFESCVSQNEDTFTFDFAPSVAEEQDTSLEESALQTLQESIWVYVCGEVKNPGVYELKAGSRIFEAVEAAGGMSAQAAEEAVNLAQLLADGQQIQIPSKQQEQAVMSTVQAQTGMISLNSATKEQLMQLSGIGESKAQAILDYRQEHGRFAAIEELKQVSGIGERLFEQIKGQVTLD